MQVEPRFTAAKAHNRMTASRHIGSTTLIVNPTAGGGRAGAAAHAAAGVIRAAGVTLDLRTTTERGHAEVLAAEAAARGAVRILVAGGDGTMHEAVNGLAGTGCALGLLPAGRGNDLAMALGVPSNPAAAARWFLDGPVARIDLGVINGRRFATVAAIGFDAEVAVRTRAGVWRHLGRLAYPAGVLATLVRHRAPRLTLTGEFGRREGRYLLAAVSNTGIYGGGVRIVPGSRPDDGRLDICAVAAMSRWRVIRVLPRAYRGGHVTAPEVEMLEARDLTIEADRPCPLIADGEPAGMSPARLHLEPLALAVVATIPRHG